MYNTSHDFYNILSQNKSSMDIKSTHVNSCISSLTEQISLVLYIYEAQWVKQLN